MKKESDNLRYCISCGQRELKVPNGLFNPLDGRKDYDILCMNKKCKKGAENICKKETGHKSKWFLNECKFCGADLSCPYFP